jgi:hypothetical protein
MARLNSKTPSQVLLDSITRQYGVHMHDLLEDSANVAPQLVAQATNWSTAYEAMRTHARHQISANPNWGAIKEVNFNNHYEIHGSKGRVRLHYEIDAIYPTGQDASGATIWTRMDDLTPPPVHYGMYVDLYREDKNRAESFFIGGFKSLGEATFSMKQSAGAYMNQHKGVELYESRLDLLDKKGKVMQRYSVKQGSRNEHGAFVADEKWNLDWDAVRNGRPLAVDRKPSVLRLDAAMSDSASPLPQTAEQVVHQPKTEAPVQATPKPQTARATRCKSEQPAPEDAPPVVEAASEAAQLPPAKLIRRQSKLAAPNTEQDEVKSDVKPAAAPASKSKAKTSPTPYCTCRLPDDGNFMISCDNDACPIKWYHGHCVGIRPDLPEGTEWYCALCTTERDNKKAKGKAKAPPKTPAKTPKKGGGRGGGGVGGSAVKAKGKGRGRKSGI